VGGIERVLEIAASTRVLHERRLAAIEASPSGALLGREIVTFRGFAERCVAETGVAVRAVLDASSFAELVAWCARAKGVLGARLAERPGLAPALAATVRDLRDAGLPWRELPRAQRDLAWVFREVEEALARLERDGVFDRVGLFRLAERGAREHLARRGFTRVEVHGATELVGSVGDLIAVAARHVELRFFQPDFGGAWAERLRAEWPWPFEPEETQVVGDPALDPDGDVRPEVLSVRRARSPRAELDGVAREVLARIEAGVAPGDIQIVARSLEPYAPWLEPIFRGYGIPFTSSLRVPDVAAPGRRAWLDLARAVTRDLEREAVVRVAESLEPSVGVRLAPEVAALAERVARERAVVRGVRDWQAALAGEKAAGAARDALERLLTRLAAASLALDPSPDFATAARVLAELGSELFAAESAAAAHEPLAAVARLDAVRAAAGVSGEIERPELGRMLDAALCEQSSTPFSEDQGGVRVLDAVQARALPCRHLFLLGLVHGAWPRALADDPFLPDGVRAALREKLRRPIPLRGTVADEDRFLLGLLLSQARESVVLSWAESDSSGRAQSPSALLRSLPFVASGTNVVPDEPQGWEDGERTSLRIGEALCAAAGAEELGAISARLPPVEAETLRAGLELVRCIDAPDAEALPYDGEVDDALALPAQLFPSDVELLGQCPLRGLFERIYRADPLQPRSPDELEASEAGELVHRALERIYDELFEGGALAPGTTFPAALERARALVGPVLVELEAGQRARVRERHPTAWRAFRDTIQRALVDFLERDLASLLVQGVVELLSEQRIEGALPAGARTLSLRGKIDRIARLANGELRVGDYKTSRQFDRPLDPKGVARGLALQIPIYAQLVARREPSPVRGETLTVPLRPERDRDRDRDEERFAPAAELARLSGPALGAIAELLSTGFFPLANRKPEQACRTCPYTVACRIQHPQSAARVRASDRAAAYLALSGQSS